MKKAIAIILSIALIIPVTTSCTSKTKTPTESIKQSSASVSEPVKELDKYEVKMALFAAAKQQDSDKVWEEASKIVNELIPNTTLKVEAFPYADYPQKLQLLMAGGEKVDIAWSGYAIDYPGEVAKGSFLPLDKLVKDYGKNIMANRAEFLDGQKIKGVLYSVPNTIGEYEGPTGMRFKQDIVQYFDIKAYEAATLKSEQLNREELDILTAGLEKTKKAGKIQKGISMGNPSGGLTGWLTYEGVIAEGKAWVKRSDSKAIASYWNDNQKLLYEYAQKWYKAGYIRKDIMSIEDKRADEGVENGYIIWPHTYSPDAAKLDTKKYGFPIEIVPTFKDYYKPYYQASSAFAIPSTSKNPERAMMVMDLFSATTGRAKDLATTMIYGIEGVHYNRISQDEIKTLDYEVLATPESKYGIQRWIITNPIFTDITQGYTKDQRNFDLSILKDLKPTYLQGFVFDASKVTVEDAQITTIEKEYLDGLRYGTTGGWEAKLDEMNKRLDKAGLKKYMEELQKQIDAFLSLKK